MRLICFGDSWTAGHGVETNKKYKESANVVEGAGFINKLRVMNSWPRWLADKLGCEYVNMGVCGYSNKHILEDIWDVKDSGFFEEGDIIIVLLSYPYRFTNFKDADVVGIFNEMEIALEGTKHFYFNSFFPTFKEENEFDINSLPNNFILPNYCMSDILKEYEEIHDVSVWEYGNRKVWEKGREYHEGGFHPNLIGYKLIADFIYNKITFNNT
jgi:hypothetical protein